VEAEKTTIPSTAGPPDPATLGRQLLDAVIALEAIVPDLTPHDPQEIMRVVASAKFAHALIGPTITIVTSLPSLNERKLFDVERGRTALLFRDEIRPAAQRLNAFISALEFTINSRLAEAGVEALQTYEWARRASKQRQGANLIPYVQEMQRVIKKTINRRPKPAASTPPPPAQAFLAATPSKVDEADLPESYRQLLADEKK
jgi:hypothetical protein